jgi:hypothetical protein
MESQLRLATHNKLMIAQDIANFLNLKPSDGGERQLIYRPILRKITGSTNAAILLNQICFHFMNNDCQAFYKFIKPCKHQKYRVGDSWTEELGDLSFDEFNTAIRKIATKVTTGSNKWQLYGNAMVIYWTDSSRVTWFEVNPINLAKQILCATNQAVEEAPDSAKSYYLNRLESWITMYSEKVQLPLSSESLTEKESNIPSRDGRNSELQAGDDVQEAAMPSASLTEKKENAVEPFEEDRLQISISELTEHPMWKYLSKKTGVYIPTKKMQELLTTKILRFTYDGRVVAYFCLLELWQHHTGFAVFVEERVSELLSIKHGVKLINILKHLIKLDAAPSDENPLGMLGFLHWREQNPTICFPGLAQIADEATVGSEEEMYQF